MKISNINLCKERDCTGCFACQASCSRKAIKTREGVEGFLFPAIDYSICVSCGKCISSCPVLNPIIKYKKGKTYAAWSKNDEIRRHSSSGGLFSEFASVIINEGGFVIGASLDDKTGKVNHIIIDCISDLYRIQGSKYVQSNISLVTLQFMCKELVKGKKILFTGTPCQIAGVRKLTKDNINLYTMDLVCHGVPSPKIFELVHSSVRKRIKHFDNYFFRGLSDWVVRANVNIRVDGKIINKPLDGEETFYQDAFMKGYLHRENCYNCKYASLERIGDVTVADFWGVGTKKPINKDFKMGCSAVLVNSDKGAWLFNSIKERIFFEERDIHETIDAGNDQLTHPSIRPQERDYFYIDAYTLNFKDLIRKYNLRYQKKISLLSLLKSKIKSILSLG